MLIALVILFRVIKLIAQTQDIKARFLKICVQPIGTVNIITASPQRLPTQYISSRLQQVALIPVRAAH